jgi:asparagine synthase (glutamine-hydrolysing)
MLNGHTDDNRSVYGFASELKMLDALSEDNISFHIETFEPGTYSVLESSSSGKYNPKHSKKYINFPTKEIFPENIDYSIYSSFVEAVKKRIVGTTERPVACLLSGGLDSSIVAGLVNKFYDGVLETYSIGLAESEDLKYSSIVAAHLKTKHTQIVVTEQEFFDAIPEVIKTIESYDTTTIRASVGNYLIGKYIAEHSDAKVIFNGDGADELMGGYLYFHKSPNMNEFDTECRRLLSDIHYFDVLRSDRCISSHGLEPRTPFLDKDWVDFYLSLPKTVRYHPAKAQCEKFLFRHAFHIMDPELIPGGTLWRKKEAFSDGVSGMARPWFAIIEEKIEFLCKEDKSLLKSLSKNLEKTGSFIINPPQTLEQSYYRAIYDSHYAGNAHTIPYFWMPKYVDATDSSARTLMVYNDS